MGTTLWCRPQPNPVGRRIRVRESASEVIDDLVESCDKSRDELEQMVSDQLAEWDDEGVIVSDEPGGEMKLQAANVVAGQINIRDADATANSEAVPALALGYQPEPDSGLYDGYGMRWAGIVNPPNGPAGPAVGVFDGGDGLDVEHMKAAFRPLETIRVTGEIRRVGTYDSEPTVKKAGAPTYNLESTGDTIIERVDPANAEPGDPIADLPSEREPKRQMIHQNFIPESECVTLQNYAEHKCTENANGWPAGFGADMKRVRGEVVDAVTFDYGSGLMTVSDETVVVEEEVDDELLSDAQRTPGMQVEIANELIYGEGSVLDVYGYVSQRQDGQYQFSAFGAVPIVEFAYDDDVVETGGSSNDEAIDENTI